MKQYKLPSAMIMNIGSCDVITASGDIDIFAGDPTATTPSSWKDLLID